jgi:phage-related tail fiber protein
MEFITILTNSGKAKIAQVQANNLSLSLTHLAVGDSGGEYYELDESQTALVNEVYRGTINRIYQDEEYPQRVVIDTVIPANVGGFYIREAGIFDIDGDLIAISKIPETYKPHQSEGSTRDLYIKLVIEVASVSAIEIIVDPSVIMATRQYVDLNHNNAPDAHQNRWVKKIGDAMSGNLSIPDGVENAHAVNFGQLSSGLDRKSDKTHTHLDIIPAGAVLYFAMINAPSGWLICDGSLISRAIYQRLFEVTGTIFGAGDGLTTFMLPDLRGEFIRGADLSRGIDHGRILGSFQNDLIKDHTHSSWYGARTVSPGSDPSVPAGNYSTITGGITSGGGSETRPRNIALLPCIKA